MESIEENDVDISKLWLWKKEVSIVDDKGQVILRAYLRLPGDAEVNRARVFALRKSAELRSKLKDKSNEERFAYIVMPDLLPREDLEAFVLSLYSREYGMEAARTVDIPIPPKPDEDADLSLHEEYQKKVDAWVLQRYEKIKSFVTSKLESVSKDLKDMSDEDLYKVYESKSTNILCEQEAADRYKDMCVYFGLYKDSKYVIKLFNDFSEFENLPIFIKEQFYKEYDSLDVVTPELKK